MAKKIEVQGREIGVVLNESNDYMSLTDIAKHRNPDAPADVVKDRKSRRLNSSHGMSSRMPSSA